MSDITLCLITKGREEYLDALLESFDRVLTCQDVKVLVILNGVKPTLQNRYSTWADSYDGRVNVHSFEVNDVRLSRFWPLIRNVNTEWISFPSDDDVLNDEFFRDWKTFQEKYSAFDAVACSMNLIDSKGIELGIVRRPTFAPDHTQVEMAAKAFNECPFLWPGLVIRSNALPIESTNSRYVADWTIGLSLILSKKVAVESRSLINYRVHNGQESAISSMSRKNFEALLHFTDFLHRSAFSEWVTKLSSEEVFAFFDLLNKYPPIYGDPVFSAEFVGVLTRRIAEIREDTEVSRRGLLTNAYAHQVLMVSNQLKFLISSVDGVNVNIQETNFAFRLSDDVCVSLRELMLNHRSSLPEIKLNCKHSKKSQSGVYVDCSKTGADLIDEVLYKCHDHLMASNQFNFSISPIEIKLVRTFRFLKRSSPKLVNRFARKLLKRS